MECHGGNGYVEDLPLARLYREAPLNSIWEGSGNVICLDVLRVVRRDPTALDAVIKEISLAKPAGNKHFEQAFNSFTTSLIQVSQ